MALSVPNTDTFSMQDVADVVGGDDLIEFFANSLDAEFDQAHKTNSDGTKNNLLNYRNYNKTLVYPEIITLATQTGITQVAFTVYANAVTKGNATTHVSNCIQVKTSPFNAPFSFYDADVIMYQPVVALGQFSIQVTSGGGFTVQPNTTYYYRAVMTVSPAYGGTTYYYGAQQSLTTLALAVPIVSLTALSYPSPISTTNVEASGYISSDGGAAVTERGFIWGLSSEITLQSYVGKQAYGSGVGSYQCATSPLTAGARNYFRAYATNSVGTAYSSSSLFVDVPAPPSVTTVSRSGNVITGNVTSDNLSGVTDRGIIWSLSANQQLGYSGVSSVSCGTGTGSFTGEITNIQYGSTHYARAYATNAYGTSYGADIAYTPTLYQYTIEWLLWLTGATEWWNFSDSEEDAASAYYAWQAQGGYTYSIDLYAEDMAIGQLAFTTSSGTTALGDGSYLWYNGSVWRIVNVASGAISSFYDF